MRKFYLVIVVLLGFFLMPATAMACGKIAKKEKCAKEVVVQTHKKTCCGDTTHSKSSNCNGKCGHGLCNVSSTHSGITLSEVYKVNLSYFDYQLKRQKSHYAEVFPSAIYYSLWLIPKIS
jgi:hypothetical protein